VGTSTPSHPLWFRGNANAAPRVRASPIAQCKQRHLPRAHGSAACPAREGVAISNPLASPLLRRSKLCSVACDEALEGTPGRARRFRFISTLPASFKLRIILRERQKRPPLYSAAWRAARSTAFRPGENPPSRRLCGAERASGGLNRK